MSCLIQCQTKLIQDAETNGFLTFDNIMDASDEFDLSVTEIDRLSESLELRGIVIYEHAPSSTSSSVEDYSKVDYLAVYREITELCPELQSLVDLIKTLPTPQHGEIAILCAQVIEGNAYARERMILLHLRVALKIALSMSKQYRFKIEDAVSSGVEGIITAVDRFDVNGFSAFQSYASLWVQQVIQRDCKPEWMEYYYPVHVREKIYAILKLYYSTDDIFDFDIKGKNDELILDIANKLAVRREDVVAYLLVITNQYLGKLFLDEKIPREDIKIHLEGFPGMSSYVVSCEDGCLRDVITDPLAQKELEQIETVTVFQILKPFFDNLTTRQREVLTFRLGLDGNEPLTLDEIGKRYGITRERVRQIGSGAIRRMQASRKIQELRELLY